MSISKAKSSATFSTRENTDGEYWRYRKTSKKPTCGLNGVFSRSLRTVRVPIIFQTS